MRSLGSLLPIGSFVLAMCTGCIVQHDNGPPPAPHGTLVVDWTIDELKDPSQCTQSSSDSIEVTVDDLNGDVIGTYEQSCEAFAESITLSPGDYTASAIMVDGSGKARTTAVSIARFSIYGNDQLDIPIDFPANSFF